MCSGSSDELNGHTPVSFLLVGSEDMLLETEKLQNYTKKKLTLKNKQQIQNNVLFHHPKGIHALDPP